jgi:hypothetical protein
MDVLRLILTRPTRVWKFKQVSGKVWRFTLFQFGKLADKHCFSSLCLALHGKLCFSSGHRDELRQRNIVSESIENTLRVTAPSFFTVLETVIVLSWKNSANAQPQYEVCFVIHFNLVLGFIKTSCTVEKPPNSQNECSLVCSLHLTDLS